MPRKAKYWTLYLLMMTLVSTHFAVAYLTSTRSYVNLVDFETGVARIPFQYRALTGWFLRILINFPGIRTIDQIAPPPFTQPVMMAWLLLSVLSMAAMIDITRRSIQIFVDDQVVSAVLAFSLPLTVYISYVALASTHRFSYPYDMLSMMLFCLGVMFLLQNRLFWFYPAFTLATLSRETSVFLIPALLSFRWTGWSHLIRRDSVHVFLLLAIWLGIKVWLQTLYGGNPTEAEGGWGLGGTFVLQLEPNLRNFLNPIYWPSIFSATGWLWVIVLFGWKSIDAVIRRILIVVTPLYLIGMLLVGRITEARIFGELIPFFAVAGAMIVQNTMLYRISVNETHERDRTNP